MAKRKKNDPNMLRDMLDGSEIIRQWSNANQWLIFGHMPVFQHPVGPISEATKADYPIREWRPINREDIQRLRAIIDSCNRLLNKLLPELKAVDLTDSRQEAEGMSATDKATRLYSVLRQSPNGRALLEALQSSEAEWMH